VLGAVRPSLRQLLPADHGQHPTRLFEAVSDDEAFAALYRAYASGVHAAAYRVLGRVSDAEDVTQEVFARFWRDPRRFDPKRGELGPYLRLMARSRALDLWRHDQAAERARDRLTVVARDAGPPVDELPAAVAEREERRRAVRAAVKRLPSAQREALVLSYWGSLTPHEIAHRVGVPFGTARSRIRLGLEKLRRECSPALADAAGEG
jgi:RNA polymerase sigma-70 factor (ECF subfamily)